jgi:serpin B
MSRHAESTTDVEDAFAWALFAKLTVQDGNVVVSPTSVEACVLMALAGARGATASQMAQALQLPDAKEIDIARLLDRDATRAAGPAPEAEAPGSKLVIANSAWVQQGFPIQDAYRKLLETNGRATLESVDFAAQTEAARRAINAWVDGRTEHKIHELLAPGALASSARLVLANAIYFKGPWARPFHKEATKPQPFLRPGQPPISVPLMHLDARFRYLETDSYQAVELPYKQSDVSMVVWLPRKAEALGKLERELSATSIAASLKSLATANVELFLPKFKINNTTSLAKPLADLGMKDAFSPAADFSGISSQSLSISAVVHQALVEVDEVGTEAAAATAMVAVGAARPDLREQKIFRADHPFLFAIRNHTSGEILFIGRVVAPGP